MKSVKLYVIANVLIALALVSIGFANCDNATALSKSADSVFDGANSRDSGALSSKLEAPTVLDPKVPQWPECSLALLNDSDRDTFIAHAKKWTPECRMRAIKDACSLHCIYGDEYMVMIESAADLAEGRALLGAVLTINESRLKHARAALTDAKRFATYAKTTVPHGSAAVGGQECQLRMRRDHDLLSGLQQNADKPFTRNIVWSAFMHAKGCVTCSESVGRERECKWMQEAISKGDTELRKAEKDQADTRTVFNRKPKQ